MIYSFPEPWQPGILVKRYQRFLADIRLDNGDEITAHCPNTGAMLGLTHPGGRVWVSTSGVATRKYAHTWEALSEGDTWIGVNTQLPNRWVARALAENQMPELRGYGNVRAEVPYDGRSRIDFLLTDGDRAPCYVEVKNVHHHINRVALFPDCPTERGRKHMEALARQVHKGDRAVVLYIVQRFDVEGMAWGWDFDPRYAEAADKAMQEGVEMYGYALQLSRHGVMAFKPLTPLFLGR